MTGKDRLSNSIIQRNRKRWLEAKEVWLPKDKPILEQTEEQIAELKRKKSQKDPLIDLLGL